LFEFISGSTAAAHQQRKKRSNTTVPNHVLEELADDLFREIH
jgi:hypothetical protein